MSYGKTIDVRSLREFFRDSVLSALDRQHVGVDDHPEHYVVNLLTMFSHTDSPPRLRGITWSTVSPGFAEPQYWQVHESRANTARRVIRRRWLSRGTRT